MMSQTGQQIITNTGQQILPKISRSKYTQAVKFIYMNDPRQLTRKSSLTKKQAEI